MTNKTKKKELRSEIQQINREVLVQDTKSCLYGGVEGEIEEVGFELQSLLAAVKRSVKQPRIHTRYDDKEFVRLCNALHAALDAAHDAAVDLSSYCANTAAKADDLEAELQQKSEELQDKLYV